MSSSAAVRSTNSRICADTVSGAPTHDTRVRAAGSAGPPTRASIPSTVAAAQWACPLGGWPTPGGLTRRGIARRLRCRPPPRLRRASRTAAPGGRTAKNALDRFASAASRSAGAKCEAKAKGSPKAAATCAPNVLDPRIQTGTRSPAPGTARTAWPGLDLFEEGQQFLDVRGKLVGVAVEGAAQGDWRRRGQCQAHARAPDRRGRETTTPACRTARPPAAARGWAT